MIFTGFAVVTALFTAITALSVLILEWIKDDRDSLRMFFYTISLLVSGLCFVGYSFIAMGYTIVDGTFFRPLMPILFAITSTALVHVHMARENRELVRIQSEIIHKQCEKLRRLEKRIGASNV